MNPSASAAVIVAGGPSLVGFDWSRLAGRYVIAINRAYETCPGAAVLWWSDERFWRRHAGGLLAHGARLKATAQRPLDRAPYPPAVSVFRFTGAAGFDPAAGCLRHGNNSGYAALHLAATLGCSHIVLLGYDFRHDADGRSHWHSGHGLLHRQRTLGERMLPYFETLAEPFALRGIEVVNANPDSWLTIWPRLDLDTALA